MALSSKLADNTLVVVDDLSLDQIKTKKFLEVAKALSLTNALIIADDNNANLELSTRNLPDVKVLKSQGLNVYDVLKYNNLVLVASAIKSIEGRLLA